MSEYSIRELEKLSGIKAHTIRIWEKRYNLVTPRRTSTNIRLYSDNDLKKLLNISILNRNGLKISKIANLKEEELNTQVGAMVRETWSYESQIESMLLTMIDLDELRFEKLLSKCIMQMGFEESIIRVVFPFFTRIGLMWQTGSVNPAQEHFISNLIRQKLIVAIDSVIPSEVKNGKKIIMFLPEGELHELVLLFMYYVVKKKGHKIVYLGQSIPLKDVQSINSGFNADILITYYTASLQLSDLRKQLFDLSNSFKNQQLIVSGNQLDVIDEFSWENMKKVSSSNEFIELIDSIG